MRIQRVLLVCSGNTCRSPMAAALLLNVWKQAAPGWDLVVESAGISAFPGLKASDHAIEQLRTQGLDLTTHRSKSLTTELLEESDLVLTMTGSHKGYLLSLWPNMAERIFTLGEFVGTQQEVPDPFGGALVQYRETAVVLEAMLRAVVERIRLEGGASKS